MDLLIFFGYGPHEVALELIKSPHFSVWWSHLLENTIFCLFFLTQEVIDPEFPKVQGMGTIASLVCQVKK